MKEGRKLFFVLGIILVLSFNFVSAGLFSDMWAKFTGKVIAGESASDYWTNWYNNDGPSGVGDYELISSFVNNSKYPDMCAKPIGIECLTSTGRDLEEINQGDQVICNTDLGFYCKNDNVDGDCLDYKVRFYCKGEVEKEIVEEKIVKENISFCGNGLCERGETEENCIEDCERESFCGDGVLDYEEECDDGNLVSVDGCSQICDLEPSFCSPISNNSSSFETKKCTLMINDFLQGDTFLPYYDVMYTPGGNIINGSIVEEKLIFGASGYFSILPLIEGKNYFLELGDFWVNLTKIISLGNSSKRVNFIVSVPSNSLREASFCSESPFEDYLPKQPNYYLQDLSFSNEEYKKVCVIYPNQSFENFSFIPDSVYYSRFYKVNYKNETSSWISPSSRYLFSDGTTIKLEEPGDYYASYGKRSLALYVSNFSSYVESCMKSSKGKCFQCFSGSSSCFMNSNPPSSGIDSFWIQKFWIPSESSFSIKNSVLNVNGIPFFGNGFWNPTNLDISEGKTPYNSLHFQARNNLKDLDLNKESIFFKEVASGALSLLDDQYDLLKNNPSVTQGYYIADEPAWIGEPYEQIEERYDLIDTYDPAGLKWINFAVADKNDSLQKYIENIKRYGERADIVSFDYYPSPDFSWGEDINVLENPTISGVGDFMEIYKNIFREGNKSIWFISQGFSYLNNNLWNPDQKISEIDLRFMPYQAIIHGAKGISFFGFNTPLYPDVFTSPKHVARQDIIIPIMEEIKVSESFLVTTPIKNVLAPLDRDYNLIQPFDGIEYSVFKEGSKIFVILANRYNHTVKKSFDSSSLGLASLKIKSITDWKYLFPEDRSYSNEEDLILDQKEISLNKDGSFNLYFKPYQVYLLDVSTQDNFFIDSSQDFISWIKNIFGLK